MEILQVPHHVLRGKWLLQVHGKHLQGSSSGLIQSYSTVEASRSDAFSSRFWSGHCLWVTKGGIFTFCLQKHISCLRFTDWLSIYHLKWVFSVCAMSCLPRRVPLPGTPPALKLLWKGLGFLTNTFCHRYCRLSLEGLWKGAQKKSLAPNWVIHWEELEHTLSNIFPWLGLHQPVLLPVPSQPDSSYQSQTTLSHPAPWLQGYVSITGCISNPISFLTTALYTFRVLGFFFPMFPYSYSQIQIVTPLSFFQAAISANDLGNS